MMSLTDCMVQRYSKANESWFINLESLNTNIGEFVYLLKFLPEKVTAQTACKSGRNCLVTQFSDTCLENEARIDYSTSSKYEKNYLDMYNKD